MALKPFYNKKLHLGVTAEEAKAGIKAAAGLPVPGAGDAGKVLTVNEAETGGKWVEPNVKHVIISDEGEGVYACSESYETILSWFDSGIIIVARVLDDYDSIASYDTDAGAVRFTTHGYNPGELRINEFYLADDDTISRVAYDITATIVG